MGEGHSSYHRLYVKNMNGENGRKLVLNLAFKFHNDLTVDEFKIVILLWYIWVYEEKWELRGRDISLTTGLCQKYHSDIVRTLVPMLMFKFHDDPMVNKSKIIVLLG